MTDQGRNRYYELAGAGVAEALEALSRIAPRAAGAIAQGGEPEASCSREARTCYDHLAGRLGVALARALEQRRVVDPEQRRL